MSLPNARSYLINIFIFTKSLLHVSVCYIKHIQGESLITCIKPSHQARRNENCLDNRNWKICKKEATYLLTYSMVQSPS